MCNRRTCQNMSGERMYSQCMTQQNLSYFVLTKVPQSFLFNFRLYDQCSSLQRKVRNLMRSKLFVLFFNFVLVCHRDVHFFQVDNGIMLRFSHCTNQDVNNQRVIGTSTSSMTVDRKLNNFASTNINNVISALDDAIKNRKLLILMIDDYSTIHSTRRPTDLHTSQANNM